MLVNSYIEQRGVRALQTPSKTAAVMPGAFAEKDPRHKMVAQLLWRQIEELTWNRFKSFSLRGSCGRLATQLGCRSIDYLVRYYTVTLRRGRGTEMDLTGDTKITSKPHLSYVIYPQTAWKLWQRIVLSGALPARQA